VHVGEHTVERCLSGLRVSLAQRVKAPDLRCMVRRRRYAKISEERACSYQMLYRSQYLIEDLLGCRRHVTRSSHLSSPPIGMAPL